MPIFNERKCLLKKALLKLNGFTYKELIKNKIKDFKMNTKINANKFIFKTEYLNNNNNNFNNYIECSSSYISKKTKQKEMNKNNYKINYPSIHNIINDNKGKSSSSSISSHSSDDSNNSFFKNIKKKNNNNNKTYYKNKCNNRNQNYSCNKRKNFTSNKINIPMMRNSKKIFNINSSQKVKNPKLSINKDNNNNNHNGNNPIILYDSIQKFNGQSGRSSSIFTIKYSLISLNIDLYTVMKNNDNYNKLHALIKSDEEFLSLIRNSSENQLLKFADNISSLLNDYKEIIKLGMRMKDFIRSSLLLVNSIISNDITGVFIDNTCQILKCDRASLFLLDQVSDCLIVFSGEGLKRGQIKIAKNKGIVWACFMEKKDKN